MKTMHRNERVLLKIHGTFEERTLHIFTTTEYERWYRVGDVTISSLGMLMFTNRPLLILGSSVDKDRAIRVVGDIHELIAGLVAVRGRAGELRRGAFRRAAEGDVSPRHPRPLYPSGAHDRIETSLHDVVESASLARSERGRECQPRRQPWTRAFAASTSSSGRRSRIPPRRQSRNLDERVMSRSSWARTRISAACRSATSYAAVADEFEVPETDSAAIVPGSRRTSLRTGRRPYCGGQLDRRATPTVVHEFIAALPAYTRSRRWTRTWILTTNYGTATEDALRAAHEPFHVLHYCENHGQFVHLALDGSARVIERPDAVRNLPGNGAVVVKLNGGIAHKPVPDESPVIAGDQFRQLADRIPEVLPACLQTALPPRHRPPEEIIATVGMRRAPTSDPRPRQVPRPVWGARSHPVAMRESPAGSCRPEAAEPSLAVSGAAGGSSLPCGWKLFGRYRATGPDRLSACLRAGLRRT